MQTQKTEPIPLRKFRPKWERRLPPRLTIASSDGGNSRSLEVEVVVETTDMGKTYMEPSLVDSGANGEFIDQEYVRKSNFTTCSLSVPIPVYNIDGTPNEAGSITEVVELILCVKTHSEKNPICSRRPQNAKTHPRTLLVTETQSGNWLGNGRSQNVPLPPCCCTGC